MPIPARPDRIRRIWRIFARILSRRRCWLYLVRRIGTPLGDRCRRWDLWHLRAGAASAAAAERLALDACALDGHAVGQQAVEDSQQDTGKDHGAGPEDGTPLIQ